MFPNCILFATFSFCGYPCSKKANMELQCPESYGIRPSNDRHTSLCISCMFEMYIFKIALVISENVRIAFLYILSILLHKYQCHTLIIAMF